MTVAHLSPARDKRSRVDAVLTMHSNDCGKLITYAKETMFYPASVCQQLRVITTCINRIFIKKIFFTKNVSLDKEDHPLNFESHLPLYPDLGIFKDSSALKQRLFSIMWLVSLGKLIGSYGNFIFWQGIPHQHLEVIRIHLGRGVLLLC